MLAPIKTCLLRPQKYAFPSLRFEWSKVGFLSSKRLEGLSFWLMMLAGTIIDDTFLIAIGAISFERAKIQPAGFYYALSVGLSIRIPSYTNLGFKQSGHYLGFKQSGHYLGP